MLEDDKYHLEIGSPIFNKIVSLLNECSIDCNATWSVDIMSGGFKFSDEVSERIKSSSDEVRMPAVTLLRILWAHRISLVSRSPRVDLATWWDATKNLAPRWPGFDISRTTIAAIDYAKECNVKTKIFNEEIERIEDSLQ